MGLFDKLRGINQPQFDEQRAIMTIVLAAVVADGSVDDDELRRMRLMCSLSPIFAKNTKEQDDAVIEFAVKVLKNCNFDGEQVIPKAAEVLSPDLRETAFAFACDMVMADGTVGQQEEQFLANLAKSLSIQNQLIEAVVTTTIARNRSL